MSYKFHLLNTISILLLTCIFISCSKIYDNKSDVIVRADIEKSLIEMSVNKDSVLITTLKEVSSELDFEKDDYIDILVKKFTDKKLALNKYFEFNIDKNNSNLPEADIARILKDSIQYRLKNDITLLKKRLEMYGITNYSVSEKGKYELIIHTDSKKNLNDVKNLLLTRGKIEFKLELDKETVLNLMKQMDSILAGKEYEDPDNSSEVDSSKFKITHPWFYHVQLNPYREGILDFFSFESHIETVNNFLMRKEIRKIIPDNICFNWQYYPGKYLVPNREKIAEIYVLLKKPVLTGDCIIHTTSAIDDNNMPVVSIQMDSLCSEKWAKITQENINKRIAIVLDDKVVSIPIVRSKITGGNCEIIRLSDESQAIGIAVALKTGILPIPIVLVSAN